MASEPVDFESDIDALYQLPLEEFTPARNELAKKARSSGERELAGRIKALSKPSVSAWTVNWLHWNCSPQFKDLLDAGEGVRHAQQAADSSQLRTATKQRRETVSVLMKKAESALLAMGHAASPVVLRRVETTLEALAAYGQDQPDPGPGRLAADVDPPGFEALAVFGLAPPPARKTKAQPEKRAAAVKEAPPKAPPEDRALERAKVAVREAEKTVEVRRAAADQAEAERKRAESQERKAKDDAAEARRQFEETKARLDKAEESELSSEKARQKAQAAAKEAQSRLSKAELELEEAKAQVERRANSPGRGAAPS